MNAMQTDHLHEVINLNTQAKAAFEAHRDCVYGPETVDQLFKLSEELKALGRMNRSLALEARIQSVEVLNRLREADSTWR